MPNMRKGCRSGAHGCYDWLWRHYRRSDRRRLVSGHGTAGKGTASGGSLDWLEYQSARCENAEDANQNSNPHCTYPYLGYHGRT